MSSGEKLGTVICLQLFNHHCLLQDNRDDDDDVDDNGDDDNENDEDVDDRKSETGKTVLVMIISHISPT